jgi:hypothetical protein
MMGKKIKPVSKSFFKKKLSATYKTKAPKVILKKNLSSLIPYKIGSLQELSLELKLKYRREAQEFMETQNQNPIIFVGTTPTTDQREEVFLELATPSIQLVNPNKKILDRFEDVHTKLMPSKKTLGFLNKKAGNKPSIYLT